MNVDIRRNYYNCDNCKGFGHIIRYCRDWRMVRQRSQISYWNNNHNLKEKESLVVINQTLVTTIGLQCSVE